MELFVTKINGFQVLTFVAKSSILNFVVVVNTPLQPVLWRNYSDTLLFYKSNFTRTKALILVKKINSKLRKKPGLLSRRTQVQSVVAS